MTTETLTLTAFLLARIADDEAAARAKWQFDRPHGPGCNYYAPDHMGGGDCDCNYATRVLAECEAKRRIVSDYPTSIDVSSSRVLRALAAVYADHPDYRDEWRP